MKHNYHTHTARCNHAEGDVREYIETAVQNGMETLGFSDHAPYLFPFKNYYSNFRMQLDEMEAYVDEIRSFAKEYEKDIRILCGFELEYYPDYHQEEMSFLKKVNPDYILLGQHFIGNEISNLPSSRSKDDCGLTAYVTQVLAGLATGDFLYLAHPDTAGLQYSPAVVEQEYRRLCEGAKRMGIPLELNFLGIRRNRHYPSRAFFKIAAEVGNDIIFGTDAHTPQDVFDPNSEIVARKWVEEFGLNLIEKLPL